MPEALKRKAAFLDRDGTIIQDCGHIGNTSDVVFFPFTFQALRMLQEAHLLFIVTNQSGVGLQKVSLDAVNRVNRFVLSRLQAEGIAIQELYCCSHKRDDNCECIKPKPFFLHTARNRYGIDLSTSYTIGDHPHDVEFGRAAGATGLYLLTGHGSKHRADIPPQTACFDNLLTAACWITGN